MACSQSADRDVICRTKTISTLSVREVFTLGPREGLSFSTRWIVPVFQRRYCWEKGQLKRLVADAVKLCSRSGTPTSQHSLGRIVVHVKSSGDILLIDGQQRLTTTSLFLSAIRDFIRKVLQFNSFVADTEGYASLETVGNMCHDIIYSKKESFTKLEPSYYDRDSYRLCVNSESRDEVDFQNLLDVAGKISSSNSEVDIDNPEVDDHILQNRAFFDDILADGSLCSTVARKLRFSKSGDSEPLGLNCSSQNLTDLAGICRSLVGAIADAFTILFFETQESDICSVYERLAMREAAIAKGFSIDSPGITLAEADLVRNLITSFGTSDDAQISLYKEFWAPIEHRAMLAENSEKISPSFGECRAHTLKKGNALRMTDYLNICLESFMDRNSSAVSSTDKNPELSRNCLNNAHGNSNKLWQDPGESLFPLYSGLKKCILQRLQDNGLPISMYTPTPNAEAVVRNLLIELLQYATADHRWGN